MLDLESAEWDNYHTWLVAWAYGRAGHRLNTCPTCCVGNSSSRGTAAG